MSKNLFLILSFLVGFSALGQEAFQLKGKVIADSLDGNAINIVNLTQETGTVNSTSGDFEIEVYLKDTLVFSSLQYKPVEIKITSEILEKSFLPVHLVENINQLEEVTISNINLTGNLERDISEIKTTKPFSMGMGLHKGPPPTIVERKLYTASHSGSGASLDYMLNSINGRLKMLEKAKKNDDLQALVQKGMHTLPTNFFTTDLNIPEEEIVNFIYYCAEDPRFKKFIAQKKDLELIEFYSGKSEYFIENRMSL